MRNLENRTVKVLKVLTGFFSFIGIDSEIPVHKQTRIEWLSTGFLLSADYADLVPS